VTVIEHIGEEWCVVVRPINGIEEEHTFESEDLAATFFGNWAPYVIRTVKRVHHKLVRVE